MKGAHKTPAKKRLLRLITQAKQYNPVFKAAASALKIITFITALLYLLGAVYKMGFYDITPEEFLLLGSLKNLARLVFFGSLTVSFLTDYRHNKGVVKGISIVFAALFYLSVIPVLSVRPANDAAAIVWDALNSNMYVSALLLVYAVVTISKGFVAFVSRRINPGLMFMASFALIILIGAGLLLLPKSTAATEHLSWVDALFVSTSAVCVTGLTPVDVSSVFTVQGQTILLFLIQIGGLGVMTFTCFFAMFFIGNTALSRQLIIKSMISSDSFGSLLSILVHILAFTAVIELCGATLLLFDIRNTGIGGNILVDKIFFSVFHSVSAFCNAGFSTLPGNLGNPLLMHGHSVFYWVISLLVVLGGIGFPILVNFKLLLTYKLKNLGKTIFHHGECKQIHAHIVNINSKLVVVCTCALLVAGTLAFAVLEWNNGFAGMSFSEKITHAFFNSACTRTAGFNSIDLTGLALQSVLVYIVLMWIGGASQSTAGGIKVNVFAVAMVNLANAVKGRPHTEVFGREIAPESIRKANATIVASLSVLFGFVFTISLLEPDLPFMSVVFECVSAMGTVGSSLNTTGLLGDDSKLLISALMFIGRIGVITFFMGLIPQFRISKYRFPKETVILN